LTLLCSRIHAALSRVFSTQGNVFSSHLTFNYEPQCWKSDSYNLPFETRLFSWLNRSRTKPNVQDQTAILELLGRINYRILSGKKVYIEVGGVVYKTLYGGYWRSVFTGIDHYLLRCEKISGAAWSTDANAVVDLPIAYSRDGWTASGHSLSFVLNREFTD
jgi:hypothetical protein